MKFLWLKQFMPRGLYGRAALILLVPVIAIQLVVSVAFIQRHFERVTRQMTESMLREVVLLVDRVDAAPSLGAAQAVAADLALPLGLAVDLPDTSPPPPIGDRRRILDLTGIVVIDTIREDVARIRSIDLGDGAVVVLYLDTRWGAMRISFPRDWVSATNPHQLLVLMVAVSIFMTLIAYIFLRNQLRPIHRMAEAAEAFGKGHSVPYHPSGATEVRTAGQAFLDMRERIERQIEQRTMMLSGISHDLRTPLTRLRLGLSMLPEDPDTRDDVAAMERDVREMGKMIDAFLEFSRMGAISGDPEVIDPVVLVRGVVDDSRRMGRPVEMGLCPPAGSITLRLRPDAIRRALENLIGNAVRYGTSARVSVIATPQNLRISVEDDGPGIPADRREEALKPFTRLDHSRNQNKGQGVGLGLAIASDIIHRHGGNLILSDSADMGGLCVDINLPR